MKLTSFTAVLLLAVSGAPALAQQPEYAGWGPRLGVASDPDQFVFGAQFTLDNIAKNLRFVPNIELGVGDDETILSITGPVHYVFRGVDALFTPYAGGGVTFGITDRDNPGRRGDDTDFDIAIRGIGGLEMPLKGNADFFVELSLIAGDLHDIQVMAGWNFGGRR